MPLPRSPSSGPKASSPSQAPLGAEAKHSGFALAFGMVLGLALLKFGNPVILDRLIDRPGTGLELLFQPWPVAWGYVMLGLCCLASLPTLRFQTPAPRWLIPLPFLWFVWQVLTGLSTVDARLTQPTVLHFGACVLCFYLGLFGLSRLRNLKPFWTCLLLAFAWAMWVGFEQHYGGLEATRQMFYEQPNWRQYPPEYIQKIQSNRIFSTLVYPNALAAAVLLLLPPLLCAVWTLSSRLKNVTRAVLVGVLAYASLACLFWSGSKSGWLIAMVLVLTVLLRQSFSQRLKLAIIGTILAVGLAGFFVQFAPYFRRGAPSVSARFEYWKAAARTMISNPILGTGPGTFSVAYRKIKPAGAEMAQLAHDDYLEQGSDSGVVGLVLYAGLVLGSILFLGTRVWSDSREPFAVWLGLLGWALQSFVEFPLYIPGLAWPVFALLGWLWGGGAWNSAPKPSSNVHPNSTIGRTSSCT